MKLTIFLFALIALACTVSAVPAFTSTLVSPTKQVPTETAVPQIVPLRAILSPTPNILHTCTVTAESLNVRECGDVTCAVVGWLERDQVVTSTQVISGWVWTGAGWINSVFCEEDK